MNYLNIDKKQIPVTMQVTIENIVYSFRFDYNSRHDFFTVSLAKDDLELVVGEKLCLDRPLFTTIQTPFENTFFIPMVISETVDQISYDNFGDAVLIYIFTEDENGVIQGGQ